MTALLLVIGCTSNSFKGGAGKDAGPEASAACTCITVCGRELPAPTSTNLVRFDVPRGLCGSAAADGGDAVCASAGAQAWCSYCQGEPPLSCGPLILTAAGDGGADGTQWVGADGAGGADTPSNTLVSVSSPVLSFGNVVVGQTGSTPSVVAVTNRGPATSLSPTVTGPFAIVSNSCTNLAVGGTCTIALTFTPTAPGPATGVLILSPVVSVALTGTGVLGVGPPMADRLDLGQVQVGAVVPGKITVTAVESISGLSCTTSGADIAIDPTVACPSEVAAGASCTVGFTFTATSAGIKSDSVVCSAGGATRVTQITAVVVTPASLAFQAPTTVAVSSPVGESSSPVSFTLVNTGGSASGVLTVTPSGDVTEFSVDNQCILPLAAASMCKITVTLKRTSAGVKTLILTLTDAGAPGKAPLVATVNGAGSRPPEVPYIGGAKTDFGTVLVGTNSTALVFTIINPSQSDIDALTVRASDDLFGITSDHCSNVMLGPGKSCAFSVVFTPTSVGLQSATLTVSASGSAASSLPIKGIGVGVPALTLTPSSLDFGWTYVGTTSVVQTITVTNTGQGATGALEVVSEDSPSSVGSSSQFTYTSACQPALAPKATCTIVVSFAPIRVGASSATVTVRSTDGATSSQAATLLGRGLALAGP